MAHRVRALVNKPDALDLIPGTNMMERENWLPQVILLPLHMNHGTLTKKYKTLKMYFRITMSEYYLIPRVLVVQINTLVYRLRTHSRQDRKQSLRQELEAQMKWVYVIFHLDLHNLQQLNMIWRRENGSVKNCFYAYVYFMDRCQNIQNI